MKQLSSLIDVECQMIEYDGIELPMEQIIDLDRAISNTSIIYVQEHK